MATEEPSARRTGSDTDVQPRDLTTGTEQVIRMDQLQATVETLVRQALEGLGAGSSGGPPALNAGGELTGDFINYMH